jgi:thiamine kinase-like enzyme
MVHEILQNFSGPFGEELRARGAHLDPPFSILQVNQSYQYDRKFSVMVFSSKAKFPSVVLKVSRSTMDAERLTREFEVLRQLRMNAALAETIPAAYGLFTVGTSIVLAQQFLPGTTLRVLLRSRKRTHADVENDLRLAMNWLLLFQSTTHSQQISLKQPAELERFSASTQIRLPHHLWAQLIDISSAGNDLTVPGTHRHGDLWPGNFIVDSDDVHVVDWEDYETEGTPFNDLFFFLITYARTYPWDGWRWTRVTDAFRHTFLEQNWFSELVSEFIFRYLASIAVSKHYAEVLLLHSLMEMAARQSSNNQKQSHKVPEWSSLLSLYLLNRESSTLL